MLRRLALVVVALVAVGLGASVVIEWLAESALASTARTSLHPGRRPEVAIDAFPILLRALQGRIPRVRIVARDATFDGLDVARISLDLRGVGITLGALLGGARAVTVEDGRAEVVVAEAAVNAFLARKGVGARVTLGPDGAVAVRAEEAVAGRARHVEARGRLRLSGRVLAFAPEAVTVDGRPPPAELAGRARHAATFAVELPALPAGIAPSEVEVGSGRATLVAAVRGRISLAAPAGPEAR
jgi:hypothetical protein